MGTSDAATHVTVSQLLRERGSPVSQTQHPLPQVTLQCSPARSGNELVFPYTVTNDGPGDVYVADAFHRVDPTTHAVSVDEALVSIRMEPDNFALIVRGVPPRPMMPVTRPIQPLMHRLGPGQKLDRELKVPLPLAETSPYQPYSNVRDYVLKPIEGVVLAVDWMAASTEGLVATPAVGADDLYTLHATNYLRDMQRITSRHPTRGLSILERVQK
jgi:hypothetical protein